MRRLRRLALLLTLLLLPLANAQAQLAITSPELAGFVLHASDAARNGRYAEAITYIREAENLHGISYKERVFLRQSALAYMVQSADYAAAFDQVKDMMLQGQGDPEINLTTCLRLASELGAPERGDECSAIPTDNYPVPDPNAPQSAY